MGLSDFTGPRTPPGSGSGQGSSNGLPQGFIFLTSGGFTDDDGGENAPPELLVNYNEKFADAEPTSFRDELVERTFSVLIGHSKSNVLLTGPAGVGKTRIVEDIARRIASDDPLVPEQLAEHTVFELPLSSIVSGSMYQGMLEAKIQSVIDFAVDPESKAIVFIDEIHQIVNSRDGSYSKIAEILKPAMARGDMKVIGATTTQEARDLDADPAFRRRFSRLVVNELTADQTLIVLQRARAALTSHYLDQITVTDDVLADVVRIADTDTSAGSHRPDNALTLLDRAMADRVLEQKRLITTATESGNTATADMLRAVTPLSLTSHRIRQVAHRMVTGAASKPVVDTTRLHTELRSALCGQDDVIDDLVDQVSRRSLELFPQTTPLAWIFAGASGVGKTMAAKVIARQVTGQDPILLNMTEFDNKSSINRILGSSPGYVGYDSNAEGPFDTLESNPYRVILLDEFEKADRDVQRLFLPALNEGAITTARGRVIDFSKSILIATTNAGRDSLDGKHLGFGSAPAKISTRSISVELEKFFEAELLGRFSAVMGFNPISEQTFAEIVTTCYARERERLMSTVPGMSHCLPEELPEDEVDHIVATRYLASQGARPAEAAVRHWIEAAVTTTGASVHNN